MYIQIPADKLNSSVLAPIRARFLGDYLYQEYLNFEAVHSDETEDYVKRSGKSLTILLRVLKDNVSEAFLHSGDSVIKLHKAESDEMFDYLAAELTAKASEYYFSIEKNGQKYYYNQRGLYLNVDENYNFKYIPDFSAPDWAIGAVMYQIYVDRFNNGDPSNDVVTNEYTYLGHVATKVSNWNAAVMPDDICNFYGGDLQGIIDKLDYLKELGVEVIYLNPIFVSPSNHKYDTQDYDYIDPHYGVIVKDSGAALSMDKLHNRYASMYMTRTADKANLEASNAFFCKFIEAAHENGIRVILDGVFNHCGAFGKWLDKEGFYFASGYPPGAYRDENSPYHDYFSWYDKDWPNNDCYVSWWNHDNHPKLSYETSAKLYREVMDIGRKWVSPPYNADGWRLDVAADLGGSISFNHKFWADFRKAVKSANPNAVILAEHYGDPSKWLDGSQWDTVMNYSAFMEPITWFLTGMEKHSESFRPEMLRNAMAFEEAMRYHMSRMPATSLYSAMNQLSNHDHSRFLTRTNMTVGRLHTAGAAAASQGIKISILMSAVVFQMTWPGSPTLYYGDEAGLTGWSDPDNRRPYPWGRENRVILDFHKKIIALRKRFKVLKGGSLNFLSNDYGVLSYGRFNKNEKIAVIINNNDSIRRLSVPVWKLGVRKNSLMELLILTQQDDFSMEKMQYHVTDGFLNITLTAYSSMILREMNSSEPGFYEATL